MRGAGRAALALLGLLAAGACEREERRFREVPPAASPVGSVTQNDANQPGPYVLDPELASTYEYNAYALAEGARLFIELNCNGCHSTRGGGGMGPPLADSLWIYGAEPENVYRTIVEGRPNGMPAFRGRLSNDQVWKLVAHVRALGGLTPKDTRPGRLDAMRGTSVTPEDPENRPMSTRIPEEQRPPGEARP